MTGYPLRDADIRRLLHGRLEALHAADPCSCIIHELSIPRPSARADIVALNGEICAFEIKSDVDSLSRLPRQVKAYGAVFDRASIVTTLTHLESVSRILPSWWGISSVNLAEGKLTISSVRQAAKNPALDNEALLHVCFVHEIEIIANICMFDACRKRMKKDDLIKVVLQSGNDFEIRKAAINVLKSRSAPNFNPLD